MVFQGRRPLLREPGWAACGCSGTVKWLPPIGSTYSWSRPPGLYLRLPASPVGRRAPPAPVRSGCQRWSGFPTLATAYTNDARGGEGSLPWAAGLDVGRRGADYRDPGPHGLGDELHPLSERTWLGMPRRMSRSESRSITSSLKLRRGQPVRWNERRFRVEVRRGDRMLHGLGCPVAEAAPGCRVEHHHLAGKFIAGELGQIAHGGQETPDATVRVLDGTFLPRAVRITEIGLGTKFLGEARIFALSRRKMVRRSARPSCWYVQGIVRLRRASD